MTDDSEQERDLMGASPDPRAWSDEYLAMALEEFAEADFDHQFHDCLREAADRLRGGEGEREKRQDVSGLSGALKRAAEEFKAARRLAKRHGADANAVGFRHAEMACWGSIELWGNPNYLPDDYDYDAPTDGKEPKPLPGARDEHTRRMIAQERCTSCGTAMEEGEAGNVFRCPNCGDWYDEGNVRWARDAAPDTEGREAALVKASEFHEGPYTHLAHRGDTEAVCGYEVVAWGDEPDPDATEPICAECLRQIPHPEEAGGEGGPEVVVEGESYGKHIRQDRYDSDLLLGLDDYKAQSLTWLLEQARGTPLDTGDWCGVLLRLLNEAGYEAEVDDKITVAWTSRLRGPPEGAGERKPVAMVYDPIHEVPLVVCDDGSYWQDIGQEWDRLTRSIPGSSADRTGREERDDG